MSIQYRVRSACWTALHPVRAIRARAGDKAEEVIYGELRSLGFRILVPECDDDPEYGLYRLSDSTRIHP